MQSSVLDQERPDGKHGQAMQFAIETVVSAARIDRAERPIDIGFAHIDACFYNGRTHLDFVNYLLDIPVLHLSKEQMERVAGGDRVTINRNGNLSILREG